MKRERLLDRLLERVFDAAGVLSPRGIVLDAGSRWGEWSMQIARLHPDRYVHAIDPSVDNVRALNSSIGLANMTNILPTFGALGARRGVLHVPLSRYFFGQVHNLHLLQLAQRLGEVGNYDHQARPTDQKSSFWRVPLYTVDALLQLWNETLALAHFDVEVCERVAGSNQSAVLCSAATAVL